MLPLRTPTYDVPVWLFPASTENGDDPIPSERPDINAGAAGTRPYILVVEDEAGIRTTVVEALEFESYEVHAVADGGEALAAVARRKPDLILLDMRLPVLNGWQFAEAYRQLAGPHAPIVAMTAARDAGAWADEINADGVLAKPFTIDELFEIVQRHTNPRQTN